MGEGREGGECENIRNECNANEATHHVQKEIHMRPFMNKKSHRMPIDCYFDCEIMWCSRFDCVSGHCVMMRVDKRFVQVQDQRLPLHHIEPMPGHRRQWKYIIFHWLILHKLNSLSFYLYWRIVIAVIAAFATCWWRQCESDDCIIE